MTGTGAHPDTDSARAVTRTDSPQHDDAATKLLFLLLRHAAKTWKMQPREWVVAKTPFDHHLVKPALHTKLLTLPMHEGSTRVAQRFDMSCVSTHE